MRKYLLIFLMLLSSISSWSQPDPARATLFGVTARISSKGIIANDVALGGQLTGHIALNPEVKKITSYQRKYNEYLDTLRNVIGMAAQIYGLFTEVKLTINRIGTYKNIVAHIAAHQTTNIVAVGFSKKFQYLYDDMVQIGIQVGADVAILMPFNTKKHRKSKMTGWEGVKKVDEIRQNIRKMNQNLYAAIRLLKYTTLLDVWYEATQSTKPIKKTRSMAAICTQARQDWVRHARGANEYHGKN